MGIGWLLSALGLTLAALRVGMEIGTGRLPHAVFASILCFLLAFIVPVVLEYRAVGKGLRELEGQRNEKKRPPRLSVFAPGEGEAPRVWRDPGPSATSVFVLVVFGFGLLVYDYLL